MFRHIFSCVLGVFILLNNVDAARILVIVPSPSISHQVVFRPLTQELAKRGHDVTFITTDPAFPKGQTPENLTEIDTHVTYQEWRKILETFDYGAKNDIRKQMKGLITATLVAFEEQTKLPEVQDIITGKNGSFDLLIIEAYARFALGFTHVIKAPLIAMSSMGDVLDAYDIVGAPTHPLVYPNSIATRVYNLTFWEKISISYFYFGLKNSYWKYEEVENVVVRRIFGDDTPPLSELQKNVDMLFLNIHPLWEGNRPVPPSVVHIGGLHQNPQKELPQELKNYLDNSKHGVIYISFGTNVETSVLSVEKIQTINKVFSELPYDVLWKWNQDELPGRAKNIRISKWFPQPDLLRHPKVKLFITQGGLQSTDEAITAGVPLIGIPMLGDQWYNVEKYVHHKIGKYLELATLEADTLRNTIETVIEDSSYRENIVRLRTLINDQPMSSLERAVWWTEHVLRHGGARHLRAPAANMSFAEYYEMELVLVVFGSAIVAISVIALVLIKIVKVIFRQVTSSAKIKVS